MAFLIGIMFCESFQSVYSKCVDVTDRYVCSQYLLLVASIKRDS